MEAATLWTHGPGKSVSEMPVVPGLERDTSGGLRQAHGGTPGCGSDSFSGDGAWEVLDQLPFPEQSSASAVDDLEVVAAALRVHRLETRGEYPFHGSLPSVRAKFPVLIADQHRGRVFDPWAWHWCDDPESRREPDQPRFRLHARENHLPDFYGHLRPILALLEIGITLRHISDIAAIFGSTPNRCSDDQTGLSFDLVECPSSHGRTGSGFRAAELPVNVNAQRSWADVLNHRSAGRMPRGLPGLYLTASAGMDSEELNLLQTAPQSGTGPHPDLDVTIHAAHRVGATWIYQGTGLAPGSVAEMLAAHGLPNAPRNGEYLSRAELLVFATADPEHLVRDHGPAARRRALIQAGWLIQGLANPAAAIGRICRPTRSFDDPAVTTALALPRHQHVLLAAAIGVSPVTGIEVAL
jgi:hypothetical protein